MNALALYVLSDLMAKALLLIDVATLRFYRQFEGGDLRESLRDMAFADHRLPGLCA